jgi:hypothetical protein
MHHTLRRHHRVTLLHETHHRSHTPYFTIMPAFLLVVITPTLFFLPHLLSTPIHAWLRQCDLVCRCNSHTKHLGQVRFSSYFYIHLHNW